MEAGQSCKESDITEQETIDAGRRQATRWKFRFPLSLKKILVEPGTKTVRHLYATFGIEVVLNEGG